MMFREMTQLLNRLVEAVEAPGPLRDELRDERAERSRGTAKSTSPTCDAMVFGVVPFREFGNSDAAGSPFS